MIKSSVLNEEQVEYFISIQRGKTAEEVANLMNDKFGISLTRIQVKGFRVRHKIHSGLTGRYEKGNIPWKAGKKFPGEVNSGSFKKGRIPTNIKPIGSERKNADRYTVVKVDRNTWKLKHRLIYEKHYGKIPAGKNIIFLDGNTDNFDIDNLEMVDNRFMGLMNKKGYRTSNKDLTRAGVALVRLNGKLNQIKRRKKDDK